MTTDWRGMRGMAKGSNRSAKNAGRQPLHRYKYLTTIFESTHRVPALKHHGSDIRPAAAWTPQSISTHMVAQPRRVPIVTDMPGKRDGAAQGCYPGVLTSNTSEWVPCPWNTTEAVRLQQVGRFLRIHAKSAARGCMEGLKSESGTASRADYHDHVLYRVPYMYMLKWVLTIGMCRNDHSDFAVRALCTPEGRRKFGDTYFTTLEPRKHNTMIMESVNGMYM